MARIAEHWGLTLKPERQRNLPVVYDSMITGEYFLDFNDLFDDSKPAETILEVLGWTGAVPESVDAHPGFTPCASILGACPREKKKVSSFRP
jgi:hypothetical protein